ncbi:MAG: hypothetical protein JNJ50_15345 [Acidobacteria bacterium]|nr:hypothetical protein [Acidobacteriota bacterium]
MEDMKKYALLSLITLVAVAAAIFKNSVSSKSLIAKNGFPAPYTVVLKETATQLGKGAFDVVELTIAYRSDGAYLRRARTLLPGRDDVSQRVIQFPSGEEVTVNDITKLKSTLLRWNSGQRLPVKQRNPQGKCLTTLNGKLFVPDGEYLLGEETYRGYRAVRIRYSGVEALYALDFGCAQLYDRIVFSDKESNEHNLISLSPGEPDDSLFQVGMDVKEVKPSERWLSSKKDKNSCSPQSSCGQRMRELDDEYYSSNSKPAPAK